MAGERLRAGCGRLHLLPPLLGKAGQRPDCRERRSGLDLCGSAMAAGSGLTGWSWACRVGSKRHLGAAADRPVLVEFGRQQPGSQGRANRRRSRSWNSRTPARPGRAEGSGSGGRSTRNGCGEAQDGQDQLRRRRYLPILDQGNGWPAWCADIRLSVACRQLQSGSCRPHTGRHGTGAKHCGARARRFGSPGS